MWDKLTVGQFITLYDIGINSNLNIVEKQQKMLAVVEGKKEEDYDGYKYRDLIEAYKDKLTFFEAIPEQEPVDYLQVGEDRYKFCFEVNEITAGQYIDILSFSGEIMQLHKIAACFFLPMVGDKYRPYGQVPHNLVADNLLEAKFIDVHANMVFFCRLFKELISNTLTSSIKNQLIAEKAVHLWNGMDGFIQPSRSLTGIT